eukprot:Ihof_evm2s806 gene=Ihof_evmTU2s806
MVVERSQEMGQVKSADMTILLTDTSKTLEQEKESTDWNEDSTDKSNISVMPSQENETPIPIPIIRVHSVDGEPLMPFSNYPSIDNIDMEDGNLTLKRAVTEAPEYVRDYFILKSTSSSSSLKLGRYSTDPAGQVKTEECVTWGLPILTVYRIANEYLKNEHGPLQLSYGHKCRLNALKRQILKGPYTPEKMPDIGWFDWIGYDIRNEWMALGDTSEEVAMARFCAILEECDENWKLHLLNGKHSIDEQLKKEFDRQIQIKKEEEERQLELEKLRLKREAEEEEQRQKEEQKQKEAERLLELQRQATASSDMNSNSSTNSLSTSPVQEKKVVDEVATSTSDLYDVKSLGDTHSFDAWMEQVMANPDAILEIAAGEIKVVRIPTQAPNRTT